MHRSPITIALFTMGAAAPAADDAVARFRDLIVRHEPVYFLVDPGIGPEQISVAFALIAPPDASPQPGHGRVDGLYVAYSQTSFWDLESESRPFLDSSYRPEAFWHQRLPAGLLGAESAALEPGFQHESNGKAGAESRSFNTVFLRAPWTWMLGQDLALDVEPKVLAYLGDLSENPDIDRYRGHGEFIVRLGQRDGWMARSRLRIGDEWDRGGLELAVSHPLDIWSHGWVGGYLYMQTFVGWSESLATYDEEVEQPRILLGWAMTR
jgi:outer membrane phospholipase A